MPSNQPGHDQAGNADVKIEMIGLVEDLPLAQMLETSMYGSFIDILDLCSLEGLKSRHSCLHAC